MYDITVNIQLAVVFSIHHVVLYFAPIFFYILSCIECIHVSWCTTVQNKSIIIIISVDVTLLALQRVKINKATGPGNIPAWVLKDHANILAAPLTADYVSHIHSIASLYSDIVNCLHCAASGVIPITKCNCMSDEHNTPGWNEYVKDAHSEARDAFKLWVQSIKPRQGDVFQSMKQSRARFKFKLRQCKREEARVRADILANDLVKAKHDAVLETCVQTTS